MAKVKNIGNPRAMAEHVSTMHIIEGSPVDLLRKGIKERRKEPRTQCATTPVEVFEIPGHSGLDSGNRKNDKPDPIVIEET